MNTDQIPNPARPTPNETCPDPAPGQTPTPRPPGWPGRRTSPPEQPAAAPSIVPSSNLHQQPDDATGVPSEVLNRSLAWAHRVAMLAALSSFLRSDTATATRPVSSGRRAGGFVPPVSARLSRCRGGQSVDAVGESRTMKGPVPPVKRASPWHRGN